jgi:predicted porin
LNGQDYDGLEIVQDGEIHIVPSITLDNGLTFGANIQMETADGADMDEVYITISGDTLGRVEVGSENSAGYKSMVGAPSVGGVPINSGSVSGFVPFVTSGSTIVNSFVGAGYSSYTEVGGAAFGNNDIQRISYYTPSFNGLTLGISYAPDAAGGDGAGALSDKNAVMSDIFDIGLNYSQSFGTVDVNVGARWGTGDINTGATLLGSAVTSDPETWGIGAQIGFDAFTVGGSYAENDNGVANGLGDEEGYTLGVTYDIAGPWSVGLEYLHGEGSHGAGNGKDEMDLYKLGATRELGTGVSWNVSLLYSEIDAADAATGGQLNGVAGTDIEATTLATSLNLSF